MRWRPLNGHVDWLDDVQPQQRNTVCKTMSKRTKTSVGKEVIILDSSPSSSEDEGSIENRRHGRQAANKAACKGLAKKEARPRPSKGAKPGSKQIQVRYGGAFLWSLWTSYLACFRSFASVLTVMLCCPQAETAAAATAHVHSVTALTVTALRFTAWQQFT